MKVQVILLYLREFVVKFSRLWNKRTTEAQSTQSNESLRDIISYKSVRKYAKNIMLFPFTNPYT
jgi:hypothetical protein